MQMSDSRRNYRYRLAILVAAFGVLLGIVKIIQVLITGADEVTDVTSYFLGVSRLQAGHSLYNPALDLDKYPMEYIYPPVLALLLLPLPSYEMTWWIWSMVSIISWIASIILIVRGLADTLRRTIDPVWRPILAVAAVLFPPLTTHLIWGQLQLPILLLLVACWLAVRRDADIIAGVFLGLAISLKLYPVLVVLPLLVTGRWRGAIAAMVTAAIVLGLSFIMVGVEQAPVYLTRVLPETSASLGGQRIDNLSLAMWFRFILGEGALSNVFIQVCNAMLLGGVLVCIRVRRLPADLAVSIGITLLVFMTPVVWPHYYVLLALPWLDALARAPQHKLPLVGLAWFACATPSLVYFVPFAFVAFVQFFPLLGAAILLYLQITTPLPLTCTPQTHTISMRVFR